MADIINRTLKHYACKAYKTQFDLTSSRPKGELIGECEYFATGESDRIARSLMGIKSKNIMLIHTFIDEGVYSMDIDTFNDNSVDSKSLDAISRSCVTYHAIAYKANGVDDEGNPAFDVIGECDYIGNKASDKIARKVLNIGNISGVFISHTEISNNCRYMDYQTFVKLATKKD